MATVNGDRLSKETAAHVRYLHALVVDAAMDPANDDTTCCAVQDEFVAFIDSLTIYGADSASASEPPEARCIRCGGMDDLMDVAMAPGMTYCRFCRDYMHWHNRAIDAEGRLNDLEGVVEDFIDFGDYDVDIDRLDVVRAEFERLSERASTHVRYKPCVLGSDGRCSRSSHIHDQSAEMGGEE